ncbi:unnamed protein product [Linum trigynum]|uniref:SEC7 domain-containing protein n=1 Tax=Linum trigynum TaxID=586398 RepID=A0AAV2GSN8_9ROSI
MMLLPPRLSPLSRNLVAWRPLLLLSSRNIVGSTNPRCSVVPPSPAVAASARPYPAEELCALEQLKVEVGTEHHLDWFLGFKNLMNSYYKGRVGRDVLPGLIMESILKFRAETNNKELPEEIQGVYIEKEAIILRGDWIIELQNLLREYLKGKKHLLPAIRKKLLKMRLSGKHDHMVTAYPDVMCRAAQVTYTTTRAEYFDNYANLILPDDIKDKLAEKVRLLVPSEFIEEEYVKGGLMRKLRRYSEINYEEELELYREFESEVLIDYINRVEAKEEGATTQFYRFDDDDDEKNAREVVRKYKALTDEVVSKCPRRYIFDEPKELAYIHTDWARRLH